MPLGRPRPRLTGSDIGFMVEGGWCGGSGEDDVGEAGGQRMLGWVGLGWVGLSNIDCGPPGPLGCPVR